ncbi:murein L,D-transpeptidase catalytic domain family protein [Pontibacter silvestris]|uniref:Murein L,D-transpeptidase catalytic domain family protein n=1 Tax=Pontibacter silvestris TaxID=2305183 RepID=A0ABW4WXX9_9BACT|nr:murein L,D-transpeptidase catalytic domain family protein [Pontibacter silvestris]MCC9138376.1 murein L,D-transpeptidase catalytic domain family protein [Pontibacter silvestris]
MRKPRWRYTRRKLAKGLLPLFAPLILSPIATPVATTMAKPDSKRIKARISDYKVLKFNQVAFNLYNHMDLQGQGLRFEVFDKALTGYYNLRREQKLSEKPIITIVDFTKSSTEKRLWVLDLSNKEVLYNTYVSHGRNSGEEYAENFSNDTGSYMSSIGFYVTQAPYYGKHGLSLRLDGMDEAYNSNALDRCIVMHGAEYASENVIDLTGRLGRSLGCPAIPMEHHEEIINTVVGGTTLYVHAADDAYTSQYLDQVNAMAELVQEESGEKAALGATPNLASR